MSMRRTSRRYLRNAMATSHDFEEFLNENPAVASGLANFGNLLLNAAMQSRYGPAIDQLLHPGANPAATSAEAAGATPGEAPTAARLRLVGAGSGKKKPGAPRRKVKKAAKPAKSSAKAAKKKKAAKRPARAAK